MQPSTLGHPRDAATAFTTASCSLGSEQVPGTMPVTIVDVAEGPSPSPEVMRYTEVRTLLGRDLKLGDWLDSLDRCGARMIYGLWCGSASSSEVGETIRKAVPDRDVITVMFSIGDTERIRAGVSYDVVDPDSLIEPAA